MAFLIENCCLLCGYRNDGSYCFLKSFHVQVKSCVMLAFFSLCSNSTVFECVVFCNMFHVT
jgi:hypothetical protein